MSEQQECPVYCMSKTNWTTCPVEDEWKAFAEHLLDALEECVECGGTCLETIPGLSRYEEIVKEARKKLALSDAMLGLR